MTTVHTANSLNHQAVTIIHVSAVYEQQLIITFYFEEVHNFFCSQININTKKHPSVRTDEALSPPTVDRKRT